MVDLSDDAPVFEASAKGNVPRPYASLHCKVLCWVAVIIWALYLVGVPEVAIVRLHPLARLEAVRKFIHICFYCSTYWQGRVCLPRLGSLQECQPRARSEGQNSPHTCGNQSIPSRRSSLLQDAEVGAINRHEAVVTYVVGAEPALKDNLGGGDGGG